MVKKDYNFNMDAFRMLCSFNDVPRYIHHGPLSWMGDTTWAPHLYLLKNIESFLPSIHQLSFKATRGSRFYTICLSSPALNHMWESSVMWLPWAFFLRKHFRRFMLQDLYTCASFRPILSLAQIITLIMLSPCCISLTQWNDGHVNTAPQYYLITGVTYSINQQEKHSKC